jgi:hypothetical protein
MRTTAAVSALAAACLAACASQSGVAAKAPAAPAALAGYDKTFEMQGVTFRVKCLNTSSMNQLSIVPSGLMVDNRPITQEVDGIVTGAEIADVNSDGSPEIYVYVQSAGSGSYGTVVAYSANQKRSLSSIFLPPVSEDPKVSKGYMGHDAFAVVENRFVQRFPVYKPGDTNASPTGGTRQLHYKLVPGEAGWVLQLDKVEEF